MGKKCPYGVSYRSISNTDVEGFSSLNAKNIIYIYIYICVCVCVCVCVYIYIYIYSFIILSDDRSKASSKTIPPHNAI